MLLFVKVINIQFQLSNETNQTVQTEPIEEWVFETRLLPQEVLEEEIIEHVEHRTVVEERQVPQVKSLYPFSGQGMIMTKGEVYQILKIRLKIKLKILF